MEKELWLRNGLFCWISWLKARTHIFYLGTNVWEAAEEEGSCRRKAGWKNPVQPALALCPSPPPPTAGSNVLILFFSPLISSGLSGIPRREGTELFPHATAVSARVWVHQHPPPTPAPPSLGEPLPLTSLPQGELGEMGLDGIDGEEVSRFNYVPLYRELFCWQGPGSGKHSSKSFVILQGDKGLPGSSGEKGFSGRRVGFHHIYSHKGLKGGWKAPGG